MTALLLSLLLQALVTAQHNYEDQLDEREAEKTALRKCIADHEARQQVTWISGLCLWQTPALFLCLCSSCCP
jgi:hypothetical protein